MGRLAAFGRVSAAERRSADLFFAELVGLRVRRRPERHARRRSREAVEAVEAIEQASDNGSATAAVLRTGTVRGSGLQLWPLRIASTRIGPVSGQGGLLVDTRNRLNAIIAPGMTVRKLAEVLLPLWNTAAPFVPPGGGAPVIGAPLVVEELARALLVYNRYYLRVISVPQGQMTGWAGGLRFPLPVEIETGDVATVNRDLVRTWGSGFEASWGSLLDQPAATVTPPAAADVQRAIADGVTATPDVSERGGRLAIRTLCNAVEARPFVEESFRRAGAAQHDLALAFMGMLVNRQLAIIAAQRDGAAILAIVRAALAARPVSPTTRQQEALERANTMMGAVAGIVAREPATLGGAPAGPGGTPFPDSRLEAFGTAEQTAFKRAVYNAHVASAVARGRVFRMGVDAAALEAVENGRLLRTAAPSLTALLTRARADLEAARRAGEALAVAATAIGVGSAYRGAVEELSIWEQLFPQYYEATATDRAAAAGGQHGPAAVQVMVRHYSGRKAAPGFGNHTNGIAVDFTTTQGGTALGPSTVQEAQWRASWFHRWLVGHAREFEFQPIPTEAWHWEHRP